MESNEGSTSNLRNSLRLSINKAISGDIPVKLLKESEFIFPYLANYVSEAIIDCEFLDHLKLSNILPVYKKKDPTDKVNYKPISILPLLSLVYEKQLYEYMGNFLNEIFCGFRKRSCTF